MKQIINPVSLFGFREITQNIFGDLRLVTGMSNTHPYPQEIFTYMRGNGLEAIIPCSTAAFLDFQFAGRKVQLIVEHDHIPGRYLVKLSSFPDSLAAFIVIGHRLQQERLLAAAMSFQHPFAQAALKFNPGRAEP